MHRGVYRTHGFTWSILALHAGHRLGNHLWVLLHPVRSRHLLVGFFIHLRHGGRIIAIHPHPVHFPAHGHLFFTDDWNIVFSLTSNQAGIASHTGIEINCHTPLVNLVTDEIVLFVFIAFPRRGSTTFVE